MPKKLPTYEEVLAALCAVTRAAEQHREWCRIDGSRPDIPASVVKKARELIDRATLAKAESGILDLDAARASARED